MSKPSIDLLLNRDRPLTCLTCYDYLTARVMDQIPELDMILVGDSLGNVMLGYESTLRVTIDDMVHHTAAVGRAVKNCYLIADFPFLEAALELSTAVRSARRLVQEGGAQAVKIEGGERNLELISHLTEFDLPVFGHLGLTPQSVEGFGGYKIQAKTERTIKQLGRQARALEKSGISALILECIPAQVAANLTRILTVPTIGIGAGADCDGQVLVWQDMAGLNQGKTASFVRKWGDVGKYLQEAFTAYCGAVIAGEYPAEEETFSTAETLSDEEIREMLLSS